MAPRYSDDALLDALVRFHVAQGRFPRRADWRKAGADHPTAATYDRRFKHAGGFEGAKKKAAERLRADRPTGFSAKARRLLAWLRSG